ncbi:preprotein translocase subunit YajC [Labedella endophytica]|uniref:Preprotein translocase subunit YajC n=1 Tax=Labedella endophytica TaxID=1523160 RepID=A0A433JRS1_9MICO|nr:preprotein translocase subunit YajC [Labedella endophytica]RUR00737.1 preprotein translocase subunit YajC [Labedella endophytica]
MDPITLGMLAILAVLIFFMFRNGQKRKRDTEALQSKVAPGAEVMTNFGLFGTILTMDEDDNKVGLEVAPGTVVTVHRQTIARVIDDVEAETVAGDDVIVDETSASSDPLVAGEPVIDVRTDAEKQADAEKKSDN